MKPIFLLTVALFARPLWAVNAEHAPTSNNGRITVTVEDYRVGRSDFRSTGNWDGRKKGRGRWRYLDTAFLGREIATIVRKEMQRNERFTVYDSPGLAGAKNLESQQAQDAPFNANADYIVTGEMEEVIFTVDRNETKSTKKDRDGRKREETTESIQGSAQVTIQHTARDSRTGQIWKEVVTTKTSSKSSSYEIDGDDLIDLALKSSKATVRSFVRALVPEVEGRVIGKNGEFIVIDFGRSQGVGADVDFTFARSMPVSGADGKPVLDAQGVPVTQQMTIAVQPTRKHDKPFPCIGRPEQINDSTTLVRVGYNGSGGFFGPEYEWKRSDNAFAAIREGDTVILTARPGDAK